jgi:hypothetical protein
MLSVDGRQLLALRSTGCDSRFVKAAHPIQVFAMRSRAIGLCLGIDPCWCNHSYGLRHIVRSQTAGEYDRYARRGDNAVADAPVVGRAHGVNLRIGGPIAVEE